ncbi:transposase [Natribacillus halophilus]|uniref:Transposase DDE domain-containing protein n=1 Tax=Natribacillus halophilus TaxID=549003 RepID=A0A1G8N1U2_9BACI|nr:transposase [Natribacillus halophilus]SDI74219.1 Transposase DDE domain-containing protein [Natribacillus halophilus]
MKPTVRSHDTYQNFVLQQLQEHYGRSIIHLNQDWPLILKCWQADLSGITAQLQDQYSDQGPEARDPASMLRSYLVFLFTNPGIGITKWIDEMKRTPIYAILSGFSPDDLPGVGTFYEFIEQRIWPEVDKNMKPKKQKPKKKGKKGKKGQKPNPKPGKVERIVRWLERHMDIFKPLPGDPLFQFFEQNILKVSADLGLIGDPNALSVAGDGTPVVTQAYRRSKPTCDCRANGIYDCSHHRIYSQPDCDAGWDSSREKYFNGYHLYMFTAADSPHDLPLYPRLHPASRHDAVSLVASAVEFNQRYTLGSVDRMILDAAHDAGIIYELLDKQGTEPFIDLNNRSKANIETGSDIQISPEGIPICPNGKKMKSNGFDKAQNRRKWRCTRSCGCSDATYGRTYHTKSSDNLRLFPKTPRDSQAWKDTYKRRTSSERTNKREKKDYQLEAGRHRSTMMWTMRIYGIMICQHIDAWYESQKNDWNKLKTTICPAAA